MNFLFSLALVTGYSLIILMAFVYILPVIFIIYWMLKMLKNSNEILKLNREILEKLKS